MRASTKDRIERRDKARVRRSAGRVSGANRSVHSAMPIAMSIAAPTIKPNMILAAVTISSFLLKLYSRALLQSARPEA